MSGQSEINKYETAGILWLVEQELAKIYLGLRNLERQDIGMPRLILDLDDPDGEKKQIKLTELLKVIQRLLDSVDFIERALMSTRKELRRKPNE